MFRVPLFDDEIITSFCSRLAAANGITATDFCRDMGFTFQDVINGTDSAILALSDIGRIPPERLQSSLVERDPLDPKGWKIGREVFNSKRFARSRLRFCPMCLAADDQCEERMPGTRRYIRKSWPLRFLRACPLHECEIADLGPPELASPRFHDFMETHDLALEEIRAAMNTPKPRSITDFETFVLERLEGNKCHGNILDRLPLGLGGVLCELVGTAVVHGRRAGLVDLDDEALSVACQAGFSYLRAGTGGLHLFLDEMQSSFSPPRGDYGGQAIYGKFYTNLAGRHDAELEFIKREIHDYAFKTMPLTSSASVFGTSPDVRYVSFEELYREHGINPSHLHKTSIVTGMRDPNSPRSGSLPKDLAEKLLQIINDAVLPAEAAELVGVNYQSFANYTRQGIFKPHLTSAYGVAYNARFSRSELQRFNKSIEPEGRSSSATATIFEACRKLSCSGAEIVNLLQKRHLKKVGWDDTQIGLAAVLVNLEEVATHVTLPDHGHLSFKEAATQLGLTSQTIHLLVNEGYLPAVTARNVTRRRPQRFITEADAAAFEAQYVSFFQAQLAFDLSVPQLRKIVAGLKPVFPPEAVGAKFFAREDIDAAVSAYVTRMRG